MPRLSAFTPMGQLRMSSAPSYVEQWYRLFPRMWGAQLDFTQVGSYNEEKLYAVARMCALMQAELEHADNQRRPLKCYDLLPLQELDYLLTPGPKDDYVARQRALSAAMLTTKGGIATNIVAQLQSLLGANFLAYVPNPAGTPTVYPTTPGNNPGGGAGAFKDVRVPAKFLQLVDPILSTGGPQWFAYQALDTSSVPSTVWSAGAGFSVGQQIIPTTLGSVGFYFTCSTAGTTGTTEPTWPSQVGATVVDGSVTWTCTAHIADALVKNDVAVFDPGNTAQMEKVTIVAVANTPPFLSTLTQFSPNTTRGYLYAQASFNRAHDVGAAITTGHAPYWWSTQRLSYAVLQAAAAVDPTTRTKTATLVNKLNRVVDQLAIVQPTSTTPTGGTLGPLQVGSPMGAVPVGSLSYSNSVPIASSCAFSPAQLPGLSLWLRSDQGVTATTTVSAWADFSGNGAHASAPGTQPAYHASGGPNGVPYVSFPGSGSVKLVGTKVVLTSSAASMFLVLKTNQTSTQSLLVSCSNVDTSGFGLGVAQIPGTRWGAVQGVANIAFGTATLGWEAWTATTAPGSNNFYVNGSLLGTGASTIVVPAAGGYTIGLDPGGFFANFNGNIAELIVCSGVFSTQQMASLNAYRLARYGF